MALFTKTLRKHIFVHPAQQSKLHGAIKSALLKDKKRFSDRLEGALLNVSNLRVVGNRHLIVDGFLSMEVEADFQVFCPTVGMRLDGIVNKISKGHIGCLVMDLFNASLGIPPNSSVTLNMGDPCEFSVTSVIIDGDILSLRGSLSPAYYEDSTNDGQQTYEENEPQLEEDISNEDLFAKGIFTQTDTPLKSPRKSKKIKGVTIDLRGNENETSVIDDQSEPVSSKKKSHKKRKENADTIVPDVIDIEILSPSKNRLESLEEKKLSPSKKSKKSKNKEI